MSQLTVELYPYKVSKLIIRVLQEDTVVTIGFEVEGDVCTGARREGREGYVGGFGESYGVPDIPCGKFKYKEGTLL